MRNLLRSLATLYATLVIIIAAWAVYVDIALLHSPQEHLLPDMLLLFVSAPASLSLGYVAEALQPHFRSPFVQLAWTAFCGMFQAAALFLASRLFPASKRAEA
jgi:hypothetical protein